MKICLWKNNFVICKIASVHFLRVFVMKTYSKTNDMNHHIRFNTSFTTEFIRIGNVLIILRAEYNTANKKIYAV